MAFEGKASYDGTVWNDEIREDVSDLIAMLAIAETPLLDALGDPLQPAEATQHQWLEDALNPTASLVSGSHSATVASIEVNNVAYFRAGDICQVRDKEERILVLATDGTSKLGVTRGYGGTTAIEIPNNGYLDIISNASLEGGDALADRSKTRDRVSNWCQIFRETVDISGTQEAISKYGVASEFDYQELQRMRELLRALENAVINGYDPSATQQGSDTVRRSMNGVVAYMATNLTDLQGSLTLTEARLNAALRGAWENGADNIDIIVCNGFNKRVINGFIPISSQYYLPQEERFKSKVTFYESDYGVQKVILSRWCPRNNVMLLDSGRIDVMNLRGRSFHLEMLGKTGDSTMGEIIGEYTMEFRNEAAHARIYGTPLT